MVEGRDTPWGIHGGGFHHDKHGKLAEDALIEALTARRPPSGPDAIGLDTLVVALVDAHIDRLAEDGRAIRTIDTYRYAAKKLAKFIAGVKVGESTPARVDAAIRSMRTAHGDVMAVQSKTLLKGALHLAVMANVIGSNPVRDVSSIRSKSGPKGAPALTADELRELFGKLRNSDYCQRNDLVDPITIFIATGLRRSELLGLRWADFDEKAGTLTVTDKVVRAAGKGLLRVDETKTAAGRRTVPLPSFAIITLTERRGKPFLGEQSMIFPSTAGTLRDPENFGARWRKVRGQLGVPDVTSHSFRADDVSPTRLAAAQEAGKQFAAELTPGINLGLIALVAAQSCWFHRPRIARPPSSRSTSCR